MSGALAGRRIAITRPAESCAGLARRLEDAGARVLVAPAIRRGTPSSWAPLDRGLERLVTGGYDGVLFTSPASVAPFFDRLEGTGFPEACAVGAVGRGTAAALRERGVIAGIVPEREDGVSLAAEVERHFGARLAGASFLQPRAEEGREELSAALSTKGAVVDIVPAYRTTPVAPAELEPLIEGLRGGQIDAVVFASPSAVDAVLDAAGSLGTTPAVAIGETTADALRGRGVRHVVVAIRADDDGLFSAVNEALTA